MSVIVNIVDGMPCPTCCDCMPLTGDFLRLRGRQIALELTSNPCVCDWQANIHHMCASGECLCVYMHARAHLALYFA